MLAKYIPFEIRVKSLYWVRKEKELDIDLINLFSLIDVEELDAAGVTLNGLLEKWTETSHRAPKWFMEKSLPQLQKAEAMILFLR